MAGEVSLPSPVASLSLATPLLIESSPQRRGKQQRDTSIGALHVLDEATPAPVFDVLAPDTDLHAPPPRWLQTDVRLGEHVPYTGASAASSHAPSEELDASALIAAAAPDVDFLGPSENFKKLFRMPYSNAPVSLAVHRIGNTLVLDGNVRRRDTAAAAASFTEPSAASAASPDAARATPAPEAAAAAAAAATSTTSGPELYEKRKKNKQRELAATLYSKFLYRSVQDVAADQYRTALQPKSAPSSALSALPTPPKLFRRTFRWVFHGFQLVMGNDAMIFANAEHPAVSLQLRDARERITVLQALDYWLDNVMASIPELALCYHRDGIVQGYDLIRTEMIPGLVSSNEPSFHPAVIHDHAHSVLQFLSSACNKPFGSYLIYRGLGERSLHLFDVTEITSARPSSMLSYPIAMLCYRMATKLTRLLAYDEMQHARKMLTRTTELLEESQHPATLAAALEQLAATYMLVDPRERSLDHDDGTLGSTATALVLPMDGKALIAALHHASRALQIVREHPHAFRAPEDAQRRLSLALAQCQAQLAALAFQQGKRGAALRWLRLAASGLPAPPSHVPGISASGPSRLSPLQRTVYGQLHAVLGDVYYSLAREDAPGQDVLSEVHAQPRDVAPSWLAYPTRASLASGSREQHLAACNQAYFQALMLLSKDSLAAQDVCDTVARKLGNARNELGLVYLSVHRFTRASTYFDLALTVFRSIRDVANQAFVLCNKARVPRLQAHLESQSTGVGDPGTLRGEENALYARALDLLEDAERCLGQRKAHPRIWDQVQGERAGAMLSYALRLMSLVPEAGPLAPLLLTVDDLMQRVPELLNDALQRFDMIGDSRRSAGTQFHLAQWHARLCLDPAYQTVGTRGSNTAKTVRLRTTLAVRHIERALAACRADNAPVQFLTLQLDQLRLLRTLVPGARLGNLQAAAHVLAKVADAHGHFDASGASASLLGQLTSEAQLVLRDLVKLERDTDPALAQHKELYRASLGVQPRDLLAWLHSVQAQLREFA